jgi:lipopolysaccharide/colanic/teichoic acid biosynthesis glycosyltransferase
MKKSHKPYGPYEKYIKRPQDFLCALAAIIVLSPVLLITALLVRIKLGSPVLFTQDRPGKDGKIENATKSDTQKVYHHSNCRATSTFKMP